MPRTIEITVYKFDELSPEAQNNAIGKLWGLNVGHEWWDFTYDDAKDAGLEITSFDLDRPRGIEGKFTEDAIYCANRIKENHGEECATYKTAVAFLAERDLIVDSAPKDEAGEYEDEYKLDCDLDDCENEFKRAILEDYLSILRTEYDYLTSKEQVIESIRFNDYDFTADGSIY